MLESFQTDKFEYQKLSLEEQQKRGILGRLTGVIADTINPTRNGRKYSAQLWEKVFQDPIMQEKISNRCLFGELGHPADREETDMEKIALCLSEQPKRGGDGKIYGVFDILDTPNGRILKTLCDYGCNIGVSSRGSGDVITDYDGNESVDEDTYDCQGWDAVLVPAVKEARMAYVTEALGTKKYNKTLKTKLQESLARASADDKKVIKESLDTLGVNLEEDSFGDRMELNHKLYKDDTDQFMEKENSEESKLSDYQIIENLLGRMNPSSTVEKIQDALTEQNIEFDYDGAENAFTIKNDMSAADDIICNIVGDNYHRTQDKIFIDENFNEAQNEAVDNNEAVVEELQNSLRQVKLLQEKLVKLQDKLSVSYAKESKLEEQIEKQKSAISRLTENATKVTALRNKIDTLQETKKLLESKLSDSDNTIKSLRESIKESRNKRVSLQEKISKESDSNSRLNEELTKLKTDNANLTESLESIKKDFELKKSEYSKNIERSNTLVEKYKRIATKSVDKYMNLHATMLGVSVNEIRNKLPESYTFSDIDKACEEVREYNTNMSKLPFNTMLNENIKIKAKPAKKESIIGNVSIEDDVDDQLLSLAGLK